MTHLRSARRLSTVAGLAGVALLPLLAVAPAAFAAHEGSNRLDFDAVGGTTADGSGSINFVKGASDGTEERSVWQQALRFTGLEAGEVYSVVVKRGEGDGEQAPGSRDRTLCTFTATDAGTGRCTGRFLELRALAVAQLQVKISDDAVAQAIRTGAPNRAGGFSTTAAPAEISSNGGCSEPEQAGSPCPALARS